MAVERDQRAAREDSRRSEDVEDRVDVVGASAGCLLEVVPDVGVYPHQRFEFVGRRTAELIAEKLLVPMQRLQDADVEPRPRVERGYGMPERHAAELQTQDVERRLLEDLTQTRYDQIQ